MDKKALKKVVKAMNSTLEWHDVPESKCDTCNHTVEKRGYTSFTLDAIKSKSPEYNLLSDVINAYDYANDYVYDAVGSYLDYIEDNIDYYDGDDIDVYELAHEYADGAVDVYTSEQTKWLNSSVHFVAYLDDAVNEFGDAQNILTLAQYKFYNDAANEVNGVIGKYLDENYNKMEL